MALTHKDALSVKGRIFDIQRYSIHDGRGIRTIVFFKGCVLRCRWCCNPESQAYAIETMHEKTGDKTVGRDVTVDEVIRVLRRDLPYYQRSGGGITLSGGEALCQIDFAEALLTACRAEGFHTAIETTACVEQQVLDRALPLLDQILLDIKHIDDEKHKAFTGVSNEKILKNTRYIAERHEDLTVRVPVIPTFNDTEGEIRAISRFAASLPGVHRLHLLPYHRLGQDKYAALGRPYGMGDLPQPEGTHMRRLLEVAEESGLICRIGG